MIYVVAVGRVRSYPVYVKFPANNENNSEFPRFPAILSQRTQNPSNFTIGSQGFPCRREQGTFSGQQGSLQFEQRTGIRQSTRRHNLAGEGAASRFSIAREQDTTD